MNVRGLIVFAAFALTVSAETPALAPDIIVQHYCDALANQSKLMQGSSMDVELAGSLPKLKKAGKMHVLRRISALGRITYDVLGFEGDGTVKKQVINRYLAAEAEGSDDSTTALTPDNYNFKFKGRQSLDGRDTYLFEISPKKKRSNLVKGQLWIDADTYLRVQITGSLAKSPNILLKKVMFTRKYEIRNGISVLKQEQSVADTRVVGKAELKVDVTNFALDNPNPGSPENQ